MAATTAAVRGAVQTAFGAARDEIARARGLVHDGMVSLGQSFDVFRQLLSAQHAELDAVVRLLEGEAGRGGFVLKMEQIVGRFVEDLVVVSAASMRLMQKIEEMSPDIVAVVQGIRRVESMSRKTRFVALNATIHSARTGPAGRTFRVVADQVKALAEDAAEVSQRVHRLVDSVSERLVVVRESMSTLAAHDMNGAVAGQRRVVELLASLDGTNAKVSGALAQVERAAVEALKTMELEARVTGALDRASSRLGPLVALWDAWLAEVGDTLPPEVAARFAELEPAITKASAVKQTSLDAGTIELF